MKTTIAAFVAGAAVMALEILGSRWLAPSFGFTLTTWAFLISVTLLAGSLGAWIGGMMSSRVDSPPLPHCFLFGGLWFVACAVYAPFLVALLADLPILTGALAASAAVIGPPVLVLGAVLPLLASQTRSEHLGRTVGRLVAASTLGSLAGTLVTALVLVQRLGLRTGAFLVAVLLCATASMLATTRVGRAIAAAVGLAALGLALLPVSRPAERISRESPYGVVEVATTAGGVSLLVNGISQGTVSPASSGRGSLLAARQWVELLPWFRPAGRRALHVGLGPGIVPKLLEAYGIETTSVEVNPVVTEVAREHLGFEGRVFEGDGRAVARRLADRYSFVVLDAFQGESLPVHLVTVEAFLEFRERLTERGVLCVHLIGEPDHAVTAAVARTLREAFTHVLCLRSTAGGGLQDLFLFASEGPLVVPARADLGGTVWVWSESYRFEPRTEGAALLTDDRNPLDILAQTLARELRRASLSR